MIIYINLSDHVPVIDSSLEILTNKSNALRNYKDKLQIFLEDLPIDAHIALHQRPLDSITGLPLANLVTKSDAQSQWTRAPYSGIDMDFKGQLQGFGIGFKDTFSGELKVDFSVKSNNYQEEFIYTVEVRGMSL